MEPEELISRQELTGMLFAIADINANVEGSSRCWRTGMASKKRRKRTPEERERWTERQRRFEELIERRLERDGTTREEIRRQLGLPEPPTR